MLMFNYFELKPSQNHISIWEMQNVFVKIMPGWVKKIYLIKSPLKVFDAKPLTTTLVTHTGMSCEEREDDSIMPFATL